VRIGVIHGPNLNLLGTREPGIYGATTLAELDGALGRLAGELEVDLDTFQSNHEGSLVDRIQESAGRTDGYVVNAGGYTHTSVALRDALTGVGRPFVEVHVSNIHAREPFRRESLLASVALGSVMGFGADGYLLALRGLVRHLQQRNGR
jgi:3-dehydroquinate dehydratase II